MYLGTASVHRIPGSYGVRYWIHVDRMVVHDVVHPYPASMNTMISGITCLMMNGYHPLGHNHTSGVYALKSCCPCRTCTGGGRCNTMYAVQP